MLNKRLTNSSRVGILAAIAIAVSACATPVPSEMSEAELQQRYDQLSWDMHMLELAQFNDGPYRDRPYSWRREKYAELRAERQTIADLLGEVFDPLSGENLAEEGQQIECPADRSLSECLNTQIEETEK